MDAWPVSWGLRLALDPLLGLVANPGLFHLPRLARVVSLDVDDHGFLVVNAFDLSRVVGARLALDDYLSALKQELNIRIEKRLIWGLLTLTLV